MLRGGLCQMCGGMSRPKSLKSISSNSCWKDKFTQCAERFIDYFALRGGVHCAQGCIVSTVARGGTYELC